MKKNQQKEDKIDLEIKDNFGLAQAMNKVVTLKNEISFIEKRILEFKSKQLL